MVKHIIIWNLKGTLTEDEKQNIKLNAKKNLEAKAEPTPINEEDKDLQTV